MAISPLIYGPHGELNTAASLYTRHGFVLTGEKESDAFGKHVTEQKYEWVLSS